MNAPIAWHLLARPALQAQGLSALSQAVLQIHRGSRDWPAASFDARAMELVQTVLPFQACLWGSVGIDPPLVSPAVATLALSGLYTSGMHDDTLADCLAGKYPSAALLATLEDPLVARRVEMRLWRTSDAPHFEDADRQTLDFLLPHLVEAQRENRLTRALDDDAAQRHRRSLALCDTQGVLLQADEQGLALLRMEWPHWTGGRLPPPLFKAVQTAVTPAFEARVAPAPNAGLSAAQPSAQSPADAPTTLSPFFGRSITVQLHRCGPGVLLDVRRRTDADRLSTRQRDVARLYAQGMTGPQIAQRLGLTSSTVNNHLGVVFKKLAVKNKLQLLHAMRPDVAMPAQGHMRPLPRPLSLDSTA